MLVIKDNKCPIYLTSPQNCTAKITVGTISYSIKSELLVYGYNSKKTYSALINRSKCVVNSELVNYSVILISSVPDDWAPSI